MGLFRREELPEEDPPETRAPLEGWRRTVVLTGARGLMLLSLIPVGAAGAGVGALAAWLSFAPPIREFESYDPPEATLVLDRFNRPVAALYEQQRTVVPLTALPPQLPHAFVAIEDERFFQHFGIDAPGIARAFVVNLQRGKFSQGASTITQQTARNLVETVGRDKSLERKITEMLVSFQMEHSYSKDQILEVYLNQIYLGSGTYGVEAASRRYFGKPARDLTIPECATLAGLPQLPERYSPLNNPDISRERRDQVLFKLLETGYISDADYNRSVVSDLQVSPVSIARSAAPYYVDAVRRELADHPLLGENRLQTAGWLIRTTMDPAVQKLAEETLRNGLLGAEKDWLLGRQERFAAARVEPEYRQAPVPGQVRMAEVVRFYNDSLVVEIPGGWRADVSIPKATEAWFQEGELLQVGQGVDIEIVSANADRRLMEARLLPRHRLQGAIVCLDAATGDARALVGGRDFYDVDSNGFFNRAVMARRQAGSTFKPLFFSTGIDAGLTPDSRLTDLPLSFSDGYKPRNYDGTFRGSVTVQDALEHSRNIPTINLVRTVGLDVATRAVARFQRAGDKPWDLPRHWPVVLGTTTVTPLELAAAYQSIANGGLARGPRMIEGVWTSNGRETVIPEPPEPEQLLSSRTDAILIQMMSGVMHNGTGRSLMEKLPEDLQPRIAGKSGTTNDNRDAWFAGFTPHDVVVVWIGFDQNIPLAPGQTGSKAAGPIFADFMTALWDHKTPEERLADFRLPAGYDHSTASAEDQQNYVFPDRAPSEMVQAQ
jgi:penicillin-binding protein 1A